MKGGHRVRCSRYLNSQLRARCGYKTTQFRGRGPGYTTPSANVTYRLDSFRDRRARLKHATRRNHIGEFARARGRAAAKPDATGHYGCAYTRYSQKANEGQRAVALLLVGVAILLNGRLLLLES